MSESDWNSVTHIGKSRSGGGGGGGERPKVVKGKGAQNAVRRSGQEVITEKKFGSANSKANSEGQFQTKVANSDDIIAPETVRKEVRDAIKLAREAQGWNQSELANKCSEKAELIKKLETGTNMDATVKSALVKLQKILGVKLQGATSEIGQPTALAKKKAEREAAAEKGKGKGKEK